MSIKNQEKEIKKKFPWYRAKKKSSASTEAKENNEENNDGIQRLLDWDYFDVYIGFFWDRFIQMFHTFFAVLDDITILEMIGNMFRDESRSISDVDGIRYDQMGSSDIFKDHQKEFQQLLNNRNPGDPWWNPSWNYRNTLSHDVTDSHQNL